ncbi:MAG TPA: T9SS type A sorting domain-containing protein, partial [Ignavibacteriales bacterium]|nr:T9SS type A sorting domain-containing protein [Ignavibacteriales bacterium]
LLLNQSMEAGTHQVNFDAVGLNSGMYFYRLEAGEFVQVKKMTLLK